jgi:hypothetical protein
MKKLLSSIVLAAALLGTSLTAADLRPNSIIHVINVKWKKDASKDQIQKAIDGLDAMAKAYPGLTRVWTKTFKLQLDQFDQVIVMEFASKEAFDKYSGSDAQKEWYKVYLPIREESRTNDITN